MEVEYTGQKSEDLQGAARAGRGGDGTYRPPDGQDRARQVSPSACRGMSRSWKVTVQARLQTIAAAGQSRPRWMRRSRRRWSNAENQARPFRDRRLGAQASARR